MQEVKDFIEKHKDQRYLDFSEGLKTVSKKKRFGVRIPILRDYAKKLSNEYSLEYLMNNIMEDYYEEVMLKGFIIGNYNQLSFEEFAKYLDYFIPKITDWSICDTFVASLKITKKYHSEIWKYLKNKLDSNDEYTIRFCLVMIINYYISDDYKSDIYKIIDNINLDKYYVKMANAWLISYMLMSYFDESIKFITESNIDNFTKRKGITKAIESYRLNDEQKRVLRKIRDRIE